MKHPQVIVLDSDGWLAKQLRELAGESRWLVRTARTVDTALSLARGRSPAVLLVQFEPAEDKPAPLALVADVHRLAPDVPVVAVADSKLPDAERAAWTAAVLDLGARYVLFPPLMKPVLEDAVSGLMTATIRRVVGENAVFAPLPKRAEEVIDLADEEAEA
jgi:DNA-binding NtrC family response regulator